MYKTSGLQLCITVVSEFIWSPTARCKDCPHSTAERVGQRWQWRAHCLLPGVAMEERGDKVPDFLYLVPAEGGRGAEPCPQRALGTLWHAAGARAAPVPVNARLGADIPRLSFPLGTRAKPHFSTAGWEFLETREHRKGPWSENGDGLGIALQDHSLSGISRWQI